MKGLKSALNISSIDFPFNEVPALNISLANVSGTIPAISASFLHIFTSCGVQVGDLNNNVSEIIAPHKSPAASLDGLIPFSKNLLATIVEVLPRGSFLKYIGLPVWISAIL